MTVANAYIAKARLQTLKRYLPVFPNRPDSSMIPQSDLFDEIYEYSTGTQLSEDRDEAMRMMSDIESITAELPGLDCGSCGAPTCAAFAEDIVKNETCADECTIIMRQLFHESLDLRKTEFELRAAIRGHSNGDSIDSTTSCEKERLGFDEVRS